MDVSSNDTPPVPDGHGIVCSSKPDSCCQHGDLFQRMQFLERDLRAEISLLTSKLQAGLDQFQAFADANKKLTEENQLLRQSVARFSAGPLEVLPSGSSSSSSSLTKTPNLTDQQSRVGNLREPQNAVGVSSYRTEPKPLAERNSEVLPVIPQRAASFQKSWGSSGNESIPTSEEKIARRESVSIVDEVRPTASPFNDDWGHWGDEDFFPEDEYQDDLEQNIESESATNSPVYQRQHLAPRISPQTPVFLQKPQANAFRPVPFEKPTIISPLAQSTGFSLAKPSSSSPAPIQTSTFSRFNGALPLPERRPSVVTLEASPAATILRKPAGPPSTSSTFVSPSQYSAKFKGNCQDDGSTGRFDGSNYPHSEELQRVFQKVFGLRNFRKNQLQAINAALLNEDCFILMPTGGGKSLCYQLPALVGSGLTVVISPLRSLIQDQVQHMTVKKIVATALSADTTQEEQNDIYRNIESNNSTQPIKLLYVTPEKIAKSARLQDAFKRMYENGKLARFVIDEAHCVSQWGHDFRPDYKQLCSLRKTYPDVPMMALTATANPRVRGDILTQLGMRQPKWFMQSFNRPNLKYELRPKGKNALQDMIANIQEEFQNQSGIVYCLSKKDCDDVAEAMRAAKINAVAYHAGLGDELRSETQRSWTRDRIKVVCATIAFGMGIDKPDVRFVMHFSLPKSIEGYYQETGRAGRDGKPATCILYYNFHDAQRNRKMLTKDKNGTWESRRVHLENLQRVIAFCENKTDCRRGMLLEYFGEVFQRILCRTEKRSVCDNCQLEDKYAPIDLTEDAKAIIKCLTAFIGPGTGKNRRKNLTLIQLGDILKGSKNNNILSKSLNELDIYGKGAKFNRGDLDSFIRRMVVEEALEEEVVQIQLRTGPTTCCYVAIGKKAADVINGGKRIVIHTLMAGGKKKVVANTPLEQLEDECYLELVDRVRQRAADLGLTTSMALINPSALADMSKSMPRTEEEMLMIDGVTETTLINLKDVILPITQSFSLRRQTLPNDEDNGLDASPPVAQKKVRASTSKKAKASTASPKKPISSRRARVIESSDEEDETSPGNQRDSDNGSIICIDDSDEEPHNFVPSQSRSPYFGVSVADSGLSGGKNFRKRPSPNTGGTAKKRARPGKSASRASQKARPGNGWRSGNKRRSSGPAVSTSGFPPSNAPQFFGRLEGTLQRGGVSTSGLQPMIFNENAVETSGAARGNTVNLLRKPKSSGGNSKKSVGTSDWLMPPPM